MDLLHDQSELVKVQWSAMIGSQSERLYDVELPFDLDSDGI